MYLTLVRTGVGVPSTEEVSKPVLYSPVSQQQYNLCTVDMHTNPVHLRSSSSITIQHRSAGTAVTSGMPTPPICTCTRYTKKLTATCDVSQYMDAAAAQYADTFRYTSAVYASSPPHTAWLRADSTRTCTLC